MSGAVTRSATALVRAVDALADRVVLAALDGVAGPEVRLSVETPCNGHLELCVSSESGADTLLAAVVPAVAAECRVDAAALRSRVTIRVGPIYDIARPCPVPLSP
jgi:hypothetical protein